MQEIRQEIPQEKPPSRDARPLLQAGRIHSHASKPLSLSHRESALNAYLDYLKEGIFIPHTSALAYGACKMARALDYIAATFSKKGKLSLKTKEKALLRLALYELYYMSDTPRFAVGSSMVELAKKRCHPSYVGFLNSLLRNLPEALPAFPSLAIEASYPDKLVEELFQTYSKEEVKNILRLGNLPGLTFARVRPGFKMIAVPPDQVSLIAQSTAHYIQNPTQAELIFELASHLKEPPKTILDLCASPGGKLIALHDLFPNASLFANDVNATKITRLKENCDKYGLQVAFTEGPGESYPTDKKFDLIVLDVPCSGSGVFRKHPEARWQERHLEATQKALVDHALTLLNPGGALFYMTCSLLKRERPLQDKVFEKQILPDESGRDGGYGAMILQGKR